MKKAWRIVISIALIIILLGAVFVGVGLITGADTGRIFSVLDVRYNLNAWIRYFIDAAHVIWSNLFFA